MSYHTGGGGGGSGSGGDGGGGDGSGGGAASRGAGGGAGEQRPIQPTPVGALRFNTDSLKLEYFDGNQYVNITTDSIEQNTGATFGFCGGRGNDGTFSNAVDKINIDTTGDGVDYADLNYSCSQNGAFGSRTQAVFYGGYVSPNSVVTNCDYVIAASGGTATAGGVLTQARRGQGAGLSNSTRGLAMGGYTPTEGPTNASNVIDYTTMSEKSTFVDFGDLSVRRERSGAVASPTRGVHIGGTNSTLSGPYSNAMEFVTISTLGNAADFGDMQDGRVFCSAASNAIRGVIVGDSYPITNVITFITIATLGTDQDFGDMNEERDGACSAASPTRIVTMGGRNPSNSNAIDYGQIMSTGDFIDFGDLSSTATFMGGTSNGHGGLG